MPRSHSMFRHAWVLWPALVLAAGCNDDPFAGQFECSPVRDVLCPAGQTCIENVCYDVCVDRTDCGPAEDCVDDVCVPREVQSCGPSEPCEPGYFCLQAECVPKLANGETCGDGTSCISGECVQGNCCNIACGGTCTSCLASETGESPGECAPVSRGEDPRDECPGTPACDGVSGCFAKALGADCQQDFECQSGLCDEGPGECVAAVCGDGNQGGTEECDDPPNDGSYGGCNPDCTFGPHCGDGTPDAGHEDCDDAVNDGSYDGCDADCTFAPYCGDGDTEPFIEDCDDGVNDGSYATCNADCSPAPHCGDSNVDTVNGGAEECDDGNLTDDGNGCSVACEDNHLCGNGEVEVLFEECEPPNTAVCSASCTSLNACGNGTIDAVASETCDDDNAADGDGCSATCQTEVAWRCTGDPSACTRIIYVTPTGAGSHDGTSWSNAMAGLVPAFAQSDLIAQPVEIWVRQGTYAPGSQRTSSFLLRDQAAVLGGFAGTETLETQRNPATRPTILSCDLLGNDAASVITDNCYHVLTANNVGPSAVIDGVRVVGGNADGSGTNGNGGGLSVVNGGPSVVDCLFTSNNASGDGGAVYVEGGDLVLTDTSLQGNNAGRGGGLFVLGSRVEIAGGDITSHTADVGGGIYSTGPAATLDINTVTISDNQSTADGAAIMLVDGAQATISSSVVGNNQEITANVGGVISSVDSSLELIATRIEASSRGVGILADGGSLLVSRGQVTANDSGGIFIRGATNALIVNSLIAENYSLFFGGLGANEDAVVLVRNTTITGNDCATTVGPPCYGSGATANGSSSIELLNSIVWGNRSFGSPISLSTQAAVSSATYSVIGMAGTGNATTDPIFVPSSYRLQAASPCINSGSPATVIEPGELDLDGEARINGIIIDKGAYEF